LLQMLHVCLSVCMLGTWVSCAKTAEPTMTLFGRLTHVGPRNHVLYRGQDRTHPFASRRRVTIRRCDLLPKYFGHFQTLRRPTCAKMAEKNLSSSFCLLSLVTACCLMIFSLCTSGSDIGIPMFRKNAVNLSNIICLSCPFSSVSTYTVAQKK